MKQKKLKINLTHNLLMAVFYLVRTIARFFPPRLVCMVFGAAGYLVSYLFPRERKIALAQLRFAFGPTNDNDREYSKIFRRVFAHLGVSVAELMFINRILRGSPSKQDPLPADVPAINPCPGFIELVKRLKDKGNVFLLGAHVGSFELEAAYIIRQGVPISAAAKVQNNTAFESIMRNLRGDYGVNLIYREEKRAAVQIISAMKKRGCLAFLIDQDTGLENTFSRFFGLESASPILPLKLGIKYRVPFYTCFMYRDRPMHHQTVIDEILYDPEDPNAAQHVLDIYNERLEALIKAYPEQWIWWHKRWRRRPQVDGSEKNKSRSTDQYLSWLDEQTNARYGT